MKSKSIRDMVCFCIVGILLLGTMVFMAVRTDGNLPAYSVLNKGPQGFSVYMETLKRLDVDVQRINGAVEKQPANTIQIVAYTWWFEGVSPEMMAWVKKGGTLIIAAPDTLDAFEEGTHISSENGIEKWQMGKGAILTVQPAGITNKTLVKDTGPSWYLTEALATLGHRPVRFNEKGLFPEEGSPSLWKSVPLWLKLLICQLMLAVGAWFWMKGRRLGKPLPLPSETERTELEYLNAAAGFYQAAGCWQLMLDIYFKSLLQLMGTKKEDWLEIWKREALPDFQKAEELERWMARNSIEATAQEIRHKIMLIEHLKNVIKNRRQHPWSMMKQQ